MRSSCIAHPAKEPLIIIRQWQIEFCSGNVVAAALLSFFEYWHNIKLEMSHKNHHLIEVATAHGETIEIDTGLYQWHTTDELTAGIMGIASSKNTIKSALDLLVELKVISIHQNPNPRFKFDRTRYFLFYPEICDGYLSGREVKNDPPEIKNDPTITEITTESIHVSQTEKPTDNPSPDCSLGEKENGNGKHKKKVPVEESDKQDKTNGLAAGPGRQLTPAQAMFSVLTTLCQIDLGLITTEDRGKFNQAEKKMRDNGYTPADVEAFGEWWYKNDWRGKQGQVPGLNDIRSEWGKFKHSRTSKKEIMVFK